MSLKPKQLTIADNLLRMRRHIQRRLPGVVLSYDILDEDVLRIQLHDDEDVFMADCTLSPLRDSGNADRLTWGMIEMWLEKRGEA